MSTLSVSNSWVARKHFQQAICKWPPCFPPHGDTLCQASWPTGQRATLGLFQYLHCGLKFTTLEHPQMWKERRISGRREENTQGGTVRLRSLPSWDALTSTALRNHRMFWVGGPYTFTALKLKLSYKSKCFGATWEGTQDADALKC